MGKVEIRKKDVRIHNFRDGAVIRGDTVWEANFLSIFPLQPNGKKVEKTQSANWYYCTYIFTCSFTKQYRHSIIYSFWSPNILWIPPRAQTTIYGNSEL